MAWVLPHSPLIVKAGVQTLVETLLTNESLTLKFDDTFSPELSHFSQGITSTETFVEENEMDKDLAEEEFEGFRRRLEVRMGEEKERSDGAREGEVPSGEDEPKSEDSASTSETEEEVFIVIQN